MEHSVRRASRDQIQDKVDSDPTYRDDNSSLLDVGPARFSHIDFSKDCAVETLYNTLPADVAESRSKSRWAIINVWRPIKPITRDPLAVCDSFSVADEDLVPITMNIPGKKAWEVYYLRYNPEQAWYYLSSMQPDDVLLFKCHDSTSERNTIARRVPHTSFIDPETKNDANRESIELRCLVFF
jgi:hypothetical protein